MISRKLLLAGLGLALATMPAHAYRYRTCSGIPLKMASNNISLKASSNSFPAGYWFNGLQNAVSQFNKNPSNVFYSLSNDTNGLGLGNGENEIWGSTDQSILQGAPAIAYSYWDCYWLFGWHAKMNEGDVIFNYTNTAADPFEWTATNSKTALFNYTGTGRLLQGTAIHELGHAVGLLHVNTTYNVMGSDFSHVQTNGSVTNGYVGEDASNGMIFLYGLWASASNDLSAVHWRYTGASGEYSTHGRTRIFDNATGVELPKTTVAGETGYRVKRGQVVKAEFTYENNGKGTVTNFPVRYYISTNDTISNSDTMISSSTMTLGRDSVLTSNKVLTIPNNLLFKNYWLGAYMDPTLTVTESDRSNNGTYIPIVVVP